MKILQLLSLSFILYFSTGCVETRQIDANPIALMPIAVNSKLPLTAGLVVDKTLKEYKLTHQLVGGSAQFPIGKQLAFYAEDVARNLFKQVTVFDSPQAAMNKVDVILAPNPTRSALFIINPISVLLVIEWTVKDRVNQQTLWLTSIECQANETAGTFSHEESLEKAFQRCFDELSQKTFTAFSKSPEIRLLSARND